MNRIISAIIQSNFITVPYYFNNIFIQLYPMNKTLPSIFKNTTVIQLYKVRGYKSMNNYKFITLINVILNF